MAAVWRQAPSNETQQMRRFHATASSATNGRKHSLRRPSHTAQLTKPLTKLELSHNDLTPSHVMRSPALLMRSARRLLLAAAALGLGLAPAARRRIRRRNLGRPDHGRALAEQRVGRLAKLLPRARSGEAGVARRPEEAEGVGRHEEGVDAELEEEQLDGAEEPVGGCERVKRGCSPAAEQGVRRARRAAATRSCSRRRR